MVVIVPGTKPGDVILLFHHLPFDFGRELPIPLSDGVCLDQTPQKWLDGTDSGLADFLLPGYSLPGIGLNNCCLRCHDVGAPVENLSAVDLLFRAVLALRLHRPLRIEVGGTFRVGNPDDRILDPTRHELSSPWNATETTPYTAEAVANAGLIAGRLRFVEQFRFRQLQAGLILFGQVTTGFSKSYQLSYFGLFSALEAVFSPTGNKARSLAKRASSFLQSVDFPVCLEDWVRDEYVNGRSTIAHGKYNASFGSGISPDRLATFATLHEITRLTLLGFLSLDDSTLRRLSKETGTALRNSLDELSSPSGHYLEDQRPWLS